MLDLPRQPAGSSVIEPTMSNTRSNPVRVSTFIGVPPTPDQDELAVALPDALETRHERAQAARVHEVDPRQIQGHVVGTALDQLEQVLAERR